MRKKGSIILIVLFSIGFLFYVLPNVINQREKDHFSDQKRLESAKALFLDFKKDSLFCPVSDFYDRSATTRWLFGKHYRDVWSEQVMFPIFKGFDTLTFHKVGGGMQTTSVEVLDSLGRSFTLRTLDKDQSRVLPPFLKNSVLRPLLRDQTSALNPYNSIPTAYLSQASNISHTNPRLFIIPYSNNQPDSINYHLAGKVVLFEEEPGSKWSNQAEYNWPVDMVNTDEMIQFLNQDAYQLDTLAYLKCRLFDLLISDWDRHSGQWKWIIVNDSTRKTITPMPIDRDMALCRFDDGVINQMVVSVSNKFKSFRGSRQSILDAARKVTDLDSLLLTGTPQKHFTELAKDLESDLTDQVIKEAFHLYPTPIFKKIGKDHISTMIARRAYLTEAATEFYQNIQK